MESPVNPQESSRILTVPKKSLPTISETSYKNFEMSSHLSFPTSRNLPLSLVGKTAMEKIVPTHSGHWIFRISKTFSIIKDNRWTRVHVSALEVPLFWNENLGKASAFTLTTSFLKEKDEIGRQKVSITFLYVLVGSFSWLEARWHWSLLITLTLAPTRAPTRSAWVKPGCLTCNGFMNDHIWPKAKKFLSEINHELLWSWNSQLWIIIS